VRDKTPIVSRRENEEEFKAYCLAIVFAHTTPADAFRRGASLDVTYAHLFEEPDKYRGKVVHVTGRLKRVRRLDADPEIRETYEIPYVYEGWIFDPAIYGANPMCLLFTDLPPGIEVAETMDRRITFDGYFFKKYRYKGGDGWHDCPLLIGHSPTALSESAANVDILPRWILTTFAGVVIGTAALALGLALWYRRGDAKVRTAMASRRPAFFDIGDSAGALEETGTHQANGAAELKSADEAATND
jgi:hypothetical protein